MINLILLELIYFFLNYKNLKNEWIITENSIAWRSNTKALIKSMIIFIINYKGSYEDCLIKLEKI